MQTTIKSTASFSGVGLHTGRPVRIAIHPASAEYGIWFQRTDIENGDNLVAARWDSVVPSQLCTRIENSSGVSVSTIEHLMAALAGCGIHNALIAIDGPEVPILDGSSALFVAGIVSKGVRRLAAPVRALRIQKTISVSDGSASASIAPCDSFEIAFEIDFTDPAIGQQELSLPMANGAFVQELCDSRTFCRNSDVEAMRASGLALGGTLENAVVVDGERVLSPGGLRHRDEPVRHKMLDAMGDLALATRPILGRYVGVRAGHALTNRLMRALFADPDAYRMVLCEEKMAARLPGYGVRRADLAGLPQAA